MLVFCTLAFAHDPLVDPFRQLEEILPTPNQIRTAAGRPGQHYWQQQADYQIAVELDDKKQRIIGTETISYTNNSPDNLPYLWVQLDQNYLADNAERDLISTAPHMSNYSFRSYQSTIARETYDGTIKITAVRDQNQKPLAHTIVKTMMRVDLPTPLQPQQQVVFSIDWNYLINDARSIWARTGYEYFPEDKNYIYEIAQWYPRMASYTDVHGWHHKQFLGRGEFALEFGDFDVRITVPADHIVASTGVLKNPEQVLSKKQYKRFKKSRTANKPIYVVKPSEAAANQLHSSKKKKTWHFKANNVRDFAFASSRKFIWDSWGRTIDGRQVMAMSFYPNEAKALWSRYSTHAVAHTLDVYSRMVLPYPYPVAISVNGPIGGMEYPMICFNGPRPKKDGTYSGKPGGGQPWRHSKYGLISVIIHEVGHNWFPMIINSDERSWSWMDEGLNTFVQSVAEREWEEKYPSRRGLPQQITNYMKSSYQVPIMTNSESLKQFGNNAYAKPAVALTVLRETVLGRQLFDFAFAEYAKAWRFKRPMPADFFRIMEDASGRDLDWFWQGWFYTTKHVDIGISAVKHYRKKTKDPKIDKKNAKRERQEKLLPHPALEKAKATKKYIDRFPGLRDFYNDYDPLDVTEDDIEAYKKLYESLTPTEKSLLRSKRHFAVIDLENHGGLISPLILKVTFADKTHQELRIPAEIWRTNQKQISKLIVTKKKIVLVELDPYGEMADTNRQNNRYPQQIPHEYFDLKKSKKQKNPMQKARKRDQNILQSGEVP